MLKHRKIGDANASRLSHLPTELAKKISNSLGDLGERATEVPGLMLYRRTAPTVPNPSTSETEKSSFCSCLLLPPRVAHHVVLLCGSFRLHHSTATLPKCAPLAW